jgi:hypothetical protein
LAEILGVPPSWIYAHSRLKGPDTIPCLRVGKYLKFEFEEVLDWLKKRNEAE